MITSSCVWKYRGSEARISSEIVLLEPGVQSHEGGVITDIHNPGDLRSLSPSGCSAHIWNQTNCNYR